MCTGRDPSAPARVFGTGSRCALEQVESRRASGKAVFHELPERDMLNVGCELQGRVPRRNAIVEKTRNLCTKIHTACVVQQHLNTKERKEDDNK